MDEVGRLTRRSGAFAVREEDAELGYGQGGGNVSVGKRCSRRDERSAVAAGRAAAAVAEKGKEEEECRRRRRKSATRGWRTDMRYADALQTRSRENTRCRVPRTVSRPSEGSSRPHQNLDWCRGAHANIPAWKSLADLVAGGASTWTPGGIQWERESHWTKALAMRVGQVEGSRLKRARIAECDAAGVREIGKSKRWMCTDYRIGWLVISAKVERMSGGERRPAGKKCNIRGRYTRAREIEGSARYKPDRKEDRAP
ncbi:hypothetical protein EDB92DRAFT_1821198 [Lactarius akahatsu]|uniref:Uncharacterized protein n=1 Tax=Lactarius akahatsu TaxID=416441 RepID=A0AAD4LAK0_9AGAM|nr:hypothetical protein EDB92DRAFT_1821198 [Lactarius akahatsu]